MTPPRRLRTGALLDPWNELQIALGTADSLQESIRHADMKVAILFSVQCGVAALTAGPAAGLARPGQAREALLGGLTLLIALLAGLSTATWHLMLAIRPRLEGPGGDNRFGFPGLAQSARRPPVTGARRQRDEAWALVSVLASIATAKHQRVRRSIPWLLTALCAGIALHVVAALTDPLPTA